MSRAASARILHIEGFRIFNGPCKSCPVVVQPWIHQLCSQPQFSFYAEVDLEYASDWFNHYGLKEMVERFDEALELISDCHSKKWSELSEETVREILDDAIHLYGLIHARWIMQPKGLAQMKEKFEAGVFGECPRFACNGQKVLPIGETAIPHRHSAKVFCPKCRDVYRPDGPAIDGAHFGTAFPHAFLIEFPALDVRKEFKTYEPSVFGFKIHQRLNERFMAHSRNDYEYSESEEDEKSQTCS